MINEKKFIVLSGWLRGGVGPGPVAEILEE